MPIDISVKAGNNKATSAISATGTNTYVVTDAEQNLFGLDNTSLKKAVETYFGKKPDDVFLHSPTPWKDLYKTYQWPEVQVVMAVQSATILEITSVPTVVAQNKLTNSSRQVATLDATISQQVTATSESNWSKTDEIGVSQTISYEVGLPGSGSVGGATSLSYSHAFGKGGSESKAITVASGSGATVTLDPGESVKVQLTASRGVMKVRLVYNVYLTGCIAINYGKPFKDHHFHALDIQSVMEAAGINTSREYTEDIEIGYYSRINTEVKDAGGNASVLSAAKPAMAV